MLLGAIIWVVYNCSVLDVYCKRYELDFLGGDILKIFSLNLISLEEGFLRGAVSSIFCINWLHVDKNPRPPHSQGEHTTTLSYKRLSPNICIVEYTSYIQYNVI